MNKITKNNKIHKFNKINKIVHPLKNIRIHLQKLHEIKRHRHHPLIHEIHHKHHLSKKTLFYVKEYGSKSSVPKTIIRESIKILLFASIVSSLGGLGLERLKEVIVSILPLIIMIPVMNNMIGNYGSIVSSKFSTMLHEDKINQNWRQSLELKKLFYQVMIISLTITLMSTLMAIIISKLTAGFFQWSVVFKVFAISVIDVLFLIPLLFGLSIYFGIYYFKKGEDPNNFLIPITTSVADFGNMILLAVLVILFF